MSLRPRRPLLQAPDSLHTLADQRTRLALSRWVCQHPESAHEASRALALYGASAIRDYTDEHEDTFTVADPSAPDGYFLCSRGRCSCAENCTTSLECCHRLAVRLVLNYRAQYVRLYQAPPRSTPKVPSIKQSQRAMEVHLKRGAKARLEAERARATLH